MRLIVPLFGIVIVVSCQQTVHATDTNGVILSSYTVESSNPTTASQWRKKPIETPAVLTLPLQTLEGTRLPVIVYLPDSGGIGDSDRRWQRLFLERGYAVLQVDPYTNRGFSLTRGLGKKQTGITGISYLSDVYAAVRYLKEHPRIDPDRIVLFGRSWGGWIQVYTTMDWYQRMVGDGLELAGRIALYPACLFTIENPTPTSGSTLFVLGEKDDWNAPRSCIDYASRLGAAGGDITVEVLPTAVHGWDSGKKVKTIRGVTIWGRKCHVLWDPSTRKTWQSGSSKRIDMATRFGDIWRDCIVKGSVKYGGTKDQIAHTEKLVLSFLNSRI